MCWCIWGVIEINFVKLTQWSERICFGWDRPASNIFFNSHHLIFSWPFCVAWKTPSMIRPIPPLYSNVLSIRSLMLFYARYNYLHWNQYLGSVTSCQPQRAVLSTWVSLHIYLYNVPLPAAMLSREYLLLLLLGYLRRIYYSTHPQVLAVGVNFFSWN